jgi:hypothetical protein
MPPPSAPYAAGRSACGTPKATALPRLESSWTPAATPLVSIGFDLLPVGVKVLDPRFVPLFTNPADGLSSRRRQGLF